jgi:parallel beta-helix repeat protein
MHKIASGLLVLTITAGGWLVSSCQSSSRHETVVRDTGYVNRKRAEALPAEVNYVPTGKEVVIPKNHDGGWYKPNLDQVKPGDVLVLEGYYAYINLDSLQGTKEKPITLRNKGRVWIGSDNSYAAIFSNCSHFIIDGGGDPGNKYGIVFGPLDVVNTPHIDQGLTVSNSSNYEIKHVEIKHVQVGIFGNPPSGPTMRDIKIHDNWIHDLDNPKEGGRTEAMYLGNTNIFTVSNTAHFENIRIYNNLCENLSGDGIQLANGQNYKIYNNVIRDYGKANLDDQHTGILIGANGYGTIKNNTIQDGTGSAIEVFGYSYNLVIGNTIRNTATSANQPDAIYIEKKGMDGDPLQVDLFDNNIDGATRNGIRNASNVKLGKPGLWKHNTVVNAQKEKYISLVDDVEE